MKMADWVTIVDEDGAVLLPDELIETMGWFSGTELEWYLSEDADGYVDGVVVRDVDPYSRDLMDR